MRNSGFYILLLVLGAILGAVFISRITTFLGGFGAFLANWWWVFVLAAVAVLILVLFLKRKPKGTPQRRDGNPMILNKGDKNQTKFKKGGDWRDRY